MIFLNGVLLAGLAALAIPVILHLLNRAKPRPVDWGAMRFLLAGVAARRRRLILEEILLLAARCLLMTFIALAAARPFLPSHSILSAALVFPCLLVAAVLAAVCAALWNRETARRRLLKTLAALLVIAVASSLLERWLQNRRWLQGSEGRDIVLVLDASTSMQIRSQDKTNFERAVEEAGALIDRAGRGDAFAILLAGPVPRALVPIPIADRAELRSALAGPACHPLGGKLGMIEALNAAAACLLEGRNPAKRIVVITDGQADGWDAASEGRWAYLSDALKALPTAPQIVCRRLALPSAFRNASVADVTFSRPVVGTDRAVKIDVRVAASGTLPILPALVELLVDGAPVARQDNLREIPAGSAETFRFDYRFERPGRRIVTARVVGDDDLPADNQADRVLDVIDRLPVLVVDGAPAERFFQGAAAFVRLALTPRPEKPAADAQAAGPGFLIEPTVIRLSQIDSQPHPLPYRVVILANVPRLPQAAADRLVAFVHDGGGLLVAPGRHAEADFYNQWSLASGEPVLPATLGDRITPVPEPARLELKTFSHPALQLIANPRFSDAGALLLRTCWDLKIDAADTRVRLGGTMSNGRPFLAERSLGNGFILLTPVALDRRDSNLPSLKCFLPLVHEMVYYLAAPMVPDANVRAGTEIALTLDKATPGLLANPSAFSSYRMRQEPPVLVQTPSSNLLPAVAAPVGGALVIRFANTQEPGLYHVRLPPNLAVPAPATHPGSQATIPFAVLGQGEEAALAGLSDSDLASIRGRVGMLVADTREDLLAAFGGEIPGRELWRLLALAALTLVVVETALARWIALQRRFADTPAVVLQSPIEALLAMKNSLRNLMARSPAP